jgi:hypothetical protein
MFEKYSNFNELSLIAAAFKKIIAMTVATSLTYLCLPDMQPMTQHKQVSF